MTYQANKLIDNVLERIYESHNGLYKAEIHSRNFQAPYTITYYLAGQETGKARFDQFHQAEERAALFVKDLNR